MGIGASKDGKICLSNIPNSIAVIDLTDIPSIVTQTIWKTTFGRRDGSTVDIKHFVQCEVNALLYGTRELMQTAYVVPHDPSIFNEAGLNSRDADALFYKLSELIAERIKEHYPINYANVNNPPDITWVGPYSIVLSITIKNQPHYYLDKEVEKNNEYHEECSTGISMDR